MSQALLVGRFMLKRMARDLSSMVILLAVPLFLIPLLGLVFSWVPKDIPYMRGVENPMAFFAFGILIMFQLFGGSYSFTYVKGAYLTPMQWRMRGLPCDPLSFLLGAVGAATLVSLCQGLLVVAICRFALGVRWGSLVVVLLVLAGISALAQLAYLCLLLALRQPAAAANLGWLFAYGSCILGGLLFPLPMDKPFFRFMATYGNPYSLAQTAMRESARGGSPATAALCVGILFAAAALLALVAARLGKRRLG